MGSGPMVIIAHSLLRPAFHISNVTEMLKIGVFRLWIEYFGLYALLTMDQDVGIADASIGVLCI